MHPGGVFAVLLLLPWLPVLGAVEATAGNPQEPSLQQIENYEALVVRPSTTEVKRLAEIINPFPARKQGWIYGSIYEFHRNDNLDARNFFDPLGVPLPEYKRNQFGFTLGVEAFSKLNLLGTYEGLRIIKGSTLLSHIPTPAMKRGDFAELEFLLRDPASGEVFPENRIPEHRIHPVSRRLLSVLPDPNRPDPDRNHVNNDPLVRNQDSVTFRVDYQLFPGSKLVGNYWLSDGEQVHVHPLPSFGSTTQELDQTLRLSYSGSLGERILTSIQFRFDRSTNSTLSENAGRAGLLDSLGISGVSIRDLNDEGFPYFSLSGYSSFGDRTSPQTSVSNRYSLDGFFTFSFSDHRLRTGAEIDFLQANDNRSGGLRRGQFSFNGSFTGDAFADFLLGLPDSALRAIGDDRVDLRQTQWNVYIQDQWKITPKVELTVGLTYNFFGVPHSLNDRVSTFHPLLFEPPREGKIITAGSPEARRLGFDQPGTLVFPDRNDWSPRLALAYSPMGSNRLVLRGSFGIWYQPLSIRHFVSNLGRNFPFYFVDSAHSPPGTPLIDLGTPFQEALVTELTIRGIESHLRTGYTQFWDLALQNAVARNWNLEVAYRGRKGTGMTRVLPANVPLPGPGPLQPRRPNPDFGQFQIATSSGNYVGHELDVSAERRLSEGFSFRSGFEWNRTFSDDFSRAPANPRNLRAERSPAGWIPVRSFFLNYIVDLPLDQAQFLEAAGWAQWLFSGWRLSGVTEIQDGRPFTVWMRGDPNNDGLFGDRPDRLGPGVLNREARSIDRWFATEDFTAPPPFGFGNAGSNILTGPPYQSWDVSVIKRTRLNNGDTVEFRVEFFNAFNQVSFDDPDAVFGTSTFGKIFGARRAREIEFALKYSF